MAVEVGRQATRQTGALRGGLGSGVWRGFYRCATLRNQRKAQNGEAQGQKPATALDFQPLGSGHRSARIRAPRGTALISTDGSRAERYRSGHNGADSKSDGRVIPAREFESHPLRHFYSYRHRGGDSNSRAMKMPSSTALQSKAGQIRSANLAPSFSEGRAAVPRCE